MTGLTEAQWQRQVVGLARYAGWHVMHVRASKGRRGGREAWQTTTSIKGWPDLFMWHEGRGLVMAVELKSDTGKPTAEQLAVLDSLACAGIDTRVWQPRDWPHVEAALTGRQPAPTSPGGAR